MYTTPSSKMQLTNIGVVGVRNEKNEAFINISGTNQIAFLAKFETFLRSFESQSPEDQMKENCRNFVIFKIDLDGARTEKIKI